MSMACTDMGHIKKTAWRQLQAGLPDATRFVNTR